MAINKNMTVIGINVIHIFYGNKHTHTTVHTTKTGIIE